MSKLFVTADHHFGYANIIKLAKRPWKSLEEMDEALIKAWNDVVGPDDMVMHLGDFIWWTRDPADYLPRLNGRLAIIPGNHDDMPALVNYFGHDAVPDVVFGGQIAEWAPDPEQPKRRIVISHYPLAEWNGYYKGRLHFHGHTHGTLKRIKGRLDVGVDCSPNYAPMLLEDALKLAAEEIH